MKALAILALVIAAPALAQTQAEQGKAVYDNHCTACHGGNGGAGERAPAIVLSGANTPLRGERSDAQIMAIIRDGIPGTQMPAWGARLSAADLAALGTYIHALRGTAIDNPLPGDPVHGEAVFRGKGGCLSCHMLGGQGGVIGPDLSNIAVQRKAVAIHDALSKPDHHVFGDGGVHLPMIAPMEYDPVTVVTRDGRTIDGVMRNQDAWSVQLIGLDGRLYSFDRAGLRSVTIKPGSVMPSDYDKRLAPDEFADLLAFLTRQGSRPVATKDAE